MRARLGSQENLFFRCCRFQSTQKWIGLGCRIPTFVSNKPNEGQPVYYYSSSTLRSCALKLLHLLHPSLHPFLRFFLRFFIHLLTYRGVHVANIVKIRENESQLRVEPTGDDIFHVFLRHLIHIIQGEICILHELFIGSDLNFSNQHVFFSLELPE